MTRDSLPIWMSAGKPIAAIAIAQLLEKHTLNLDDRVAQHIPNFAQHGKDPITIRHLLLHTAGFRGPMGSFELGSWESQIDKAAALKLEPHWTPGEKAGYHPGSSWFILGELIRILDGRSYDHYVREEIFLPIGEEDAWVGMPLDRWESYGDRIAPTHITDPAQKNVVTKLNDAEIAVLPRPGANARGPIRSLAKVYEALRLVDSATNGGTGIPAFVSRLKLQPQTVRDFTTRHRAGMFDHTFKCVLDWGLGFLLDSKQYAGEHPYGYGAHASAATFGHSGNQCSCAFFDPQYDLVVAWLCNGMCGDEAHNARQSAINTAIYSDLGLVPSPGTPGEG